jgi:hypothetical protein
MTRLILCSALTRIVPCQTSVCGHRQYKSVKLRYASTGRQDAAKNMSA